MKKFVWAGLFVLAGCSQQPPDDGFGPLKFGMSTSEIERFGFKCGADESDCNQSDPPPPAGQATLFDKPVRVSTKTVGGRVVSIDVTVPNYNDDEVIELYTKAYGDPTTCRFQNALGGTMERAVWTASNGATVSVSKVLERGLAPDLSSLSGRVAFATYRSPAESKAWKSSAC